MNGACHIVQNGYNETEDDYSCDFIGIIRSKFHIPWLGMSQGSGRGFPRNACLQGAFDAWLAEHASRSAQFFAFVFFAKTLLPCILQSL